MPLADATLPGLLKLLADPTRLRILALLERDELTVSDLSAALAMAQSRVSNHLRLLRDAGLLVERRLGTSTHLRFDLENNPGAVRLWQTLRDEVAALAEHSADLSRLDAARARRRGNGDFFDRVAGQWDKLAGAFATGQARQRMMGHLLPREYVVADLGCGTGYVGEALVGLVGRLICVDRSTKMLAEAKKRLARRTGRTVVEFRRGEMDALPLADGEVDGVVAGMVLHHLPNLDAAIREMRRVLKPLGTAVILELAPHKEAWMRQGLGDRHLGLDASEVLAAMNRAGFVETAIDPIDDQYRPRRDDGTEVALPLYVCRGRSDSVPETMLTNPKRNMR
jgi:SAM-dependent methyltransferase